MEANIPVSTLWKFDLYGPDGKLVESWEEHNLIIPVTLDDMLDVYFRDGAKTTPWYVLVFEDDHTPSTSDRYSSPGFTECTAYDETTRPEYTLDDPASGQTITNSTNKAEFTFNASKTIYGAALVGGGTDPDTKGDTAGGGQMFCESQFGSSKSVSSGSILQVTVEISLS